MAQPLTTSASAMDDFSFDGARVLVTGCLGFIGGAFINSIIDRAELVVGIDFVSPFSSKKNVNESPKFQFVKGDICQSDLVSHVMNLYRPTVVCHFASMEHVNTAQYGNSTAFTKNNVVGAHTLLECCRGYGKLRKFLHVSTDEVYGHSKEGHEDSILTPSNPYAATHAAAEAIVWSYFKSFHVPAVIVRVSTVYGPRQYPEKVTPRFADALIRFKTALDSGATPADAAAAAAADAPACRAAAKESAVGGGVAGSGAGAAAAPPRAPIVIDGDGSQQRTLLYIDDCVRGLVMATERGVAGERYNLASPDSASVKQVAESLINAMGLQQYADVVVRYGPSRGIAGDTRVRVREEREKLKELGWSATVPLDEGLKQTVEWFKAHGDTWWEGTDRRQLAAHVKSKTGKMAGGVDSRSLQALR